MPGNILKHPNDQSAWPWWSNRARFQVLTPHLSELSDPFLLPSPPRPRPDQHTQTMDPLCYRVPQSLLPSQSTRAVRHGLRTPKPPKGVLRTLPAPGTGGLRKAVLTQDALERPGWVIGNNVGRPGPGPGLKGFPARTASAGVAPEGMWPSRSLGGRSLHLGSCLLRAGQPAVLVQR
jgi:hypothetical protein